MNKWRAKTIRGIKRQTKSEVIQDYLCKVRFDTADFNIDSMILSIIIHIGVPRIYVYRTISSIPVDLPNSCRRCHGIS